ncbi:transcriptional regulator, HxlR family [Anaerocolumna jejuensis DSM 15929]|uniref:Transcriptional regulator, HxlR family n=1 Tax=Anaerocolumna jejuensis DSM 15929 TaxID=1121322 RepID=A0A1M6PWH3_9FIRM|nr:helix-turn-helix domain-containing protein [Anaerocolumna jejuensis]SHK12281.1 transcriptional regulator, HxlR family [Anaerocolumna jejuensis DSM 15929]
MENNNILIPDCPNRVCPVETTLNIMSGKWKGIILFRLLGGKKRFGELKKLMPTITFRTLTLQLRQLEQDGIVQRTVYAEVPPRVDYALTALGESMRPIIQAMYDWGTDYQKTRVDTNSSELESE